MADLEGGRHGIAFASGSATTAAIAQLAGAGDEILVGDDVYGGTYRYLERVHAPAGGGSASYVDLASGEDALWEGLTARTRLVWFESPSNPLLKVTDIAAAAATIRDRAAQAGQAPPLVVVDNTFASPALQRPLELGADIVFHSATKYLGGHSDAILGIAVTSSDAVAERLRFLQNAMGGVPGPFDCFLILRGLRTLALRMERHCANATAVARFLAGRDDVAWVGYPGLDEGRHAHPGHATAARQMRLGDTPAFGGMVSFTLAAGGRGGPIGGRAGDRGLRVGPAVHPGRIAGERGVADRGAGGDDAPLGVRVRARGRPRARAAVGRDRGRRRPDRGPATGARKRLRRRISQIRGPASRPRSRFAPRAAPPPFCSTPRASSGCESRGPTRFWC